MLGSIFNNQATTAARAALDGLSRRQEAIADNVANIDTPGYRRREVSFEQALAASLEKRGALRTTHASHVARPGSTPGASGDMAPRDVIASRNDGNAVSIDEEMALLAETQIRYQALTQSLGRRLGTLRAVIRG